MSTLTVLMPVYNGLPYLPAAVTSILEQTLSDLKFLIINDGSIDGTKDYLDSLDDIRIEIIHQPKRGLGFTLNAGLTRCETEFLARMDADDIALPDRLERQVGFLSNHKEVGLVGTQIEYLGNSGRRGFSPPLPCNHEAIYADLLVGRHALCHPSIMCRTELLKRIGGYRVEGIGEDWDMMLRMGETCRLANLSEVMYLYRIHVESVNAKKLTKVRLQYAYACNSSRRRASGLPEISLEEFATELQARPWWYRSLELMDLLALAQYRRSLSEVLDGQWVRGYARMALAAVSSPRWTIQRLIRALRGKANSKSND